MKVYCLLSSSPELTTQIPVEQRCVGEHGLWTRTLCRYTRVRFPEIYGQQNVRTTVRDNTGLIHKEQTSSPEIEIKIPDPVGNRTRTVGLEAGLYRPRHGDGHESFRCQKINHKQ